MFRCHYCCAFCKAFWWEIWDEIQPQYCERCQCAAYPYRAQYVKPSRLLDVLLLSPDPNQLKLFGDNDDA